METAVQVEPIEDTTFGAWVRGVDVRVLDEDTFTTIYDAWITFGLLIFPDQFLSKDEQDTFARRFGELEFSAAAISNITRDGTVHSADDDDLVKSLKGNQAWHFDSTYMPVQAKGCRVHRRDRAPRRRRHRVDRCPGCLRRTRRRDQTAPRRQAGLPLLVLQHGPLQPAADAQGRRHLRLVRLPRHGRIPPTAHQGPPRHRPHKPAAWAPCPQHRWHGAKPTRPS